MKRTSTDGCGFTVTVSEEEHTLVAIRRTTLSRWFIFHKTVTVHAESAFIHLAVENLEHVQTTLHGLFRFHSVGFGFIRLGSASFGCVRFQSVGFGSVRFKLKSVVSGRGCSREQVKEHISSSSCLKRKI